MPTRTKLSITVPKDVLAQAERTLAQPGETRSAMVSRVLSDALERARDAQYAAGYRREPMTPEEDAFPQEAARQGFAHVAADERAAGLDAPR